MQAKSPHIVSSMEGPLVHLLPHIVQVQGTSIILLVLLVVCTGFGVCNVL